MQMDLDGPFGVLALLVHWRVALCTVGAGLLGWLLAVPLEWVSGLQGIALPLFGLFAGIFWDSSAGASPQPSARKTTLTVATLSASICGGLWGIFSFQSPLAGVAMLLPALVAWFCYATVVHSWLTTTQGLAIMACSIASYFAIAVVLGNAA